MQVHLTLNTGYRATYVVSDETLAQMREDFKTPETEIYAAENGTAVKINWSLVLDFSFDDGQATLGPKIW